MNSLRYTERRITNYIGLTAACLAMGFGLFFLGAILWTLIARGLPALKLSVFTQMTPPPGASGGLLNAIMGSIWMTGLATLIGTPIGILAGTYLAEYSRMSGGLGSIVRFINGILLSAPSVVIGFFIYTLFVLRMGHFSGWSGVFALAVIIIPVVVNNTESMLKLVPNTLREAAAALGAPRWRITVFVVYKAARAGIVTGVLLAVARISGETAPLLFTALNNQFWSWDLHGPLANLPVVIFQFAMSPYEDWQHLAWAGALLITLAVLAINLTARLLIRKGVVG